MEQSEIISRLKPTTLDLTKIYLDPNNPRFKGETDFPYLKDLSADGKGVQQELTHYLTTQQRYEVTELKNSIQAFGLLTIDLIVVLKEKKDVYVVMEGNRRTAAAKEVLKAHKQNKITLPDGIVESLMQVRVLEFDTEDLTDDEIEFAKLLIPGIRHVSGVKPWGPYQEAELVEQIISRGETYKAAGKALKISSSTASRRLKALKELKRMKGTEDFTQFAQTSLFSHFEQIFLNPSIQRWLKWDQKAGELTNEKGLRKFYQLITPDSNGKVEAKARDIRSYLPEVADCDDAIDSLMKDVALKACHKIATQPASAHEAWRIAVRDAIKNISLLSTDYDFQQDDIKLLLRLQDSIKQLAIRAELADLDIED